MEFHNLLPSGSFVSCAPSFSDESLRQAPRALQQARLRTLRMAAIRNKGRRTKTSRPRGSRPKTTHLRASRPRIQAVPSKVAPPKVIIPRAVRPRGEVREAVPGMFYCPEEECHSRLIGFWTRKEVRQHFSDCHTRDTGFSCDQCSQIFETAVQRESHKRQTHRGGPFRKPPARAIIFRREVLQPSSSNSWISNAFIQDAPITFGCDSCGWRFQKVAELYAHIARYHENSGWSSASVEAPTPSPQPAERPQSQSPRFTPILNYNPALFQ
ncbi:hypothetical protein L596_006962 [Steinernema carpocapsae]|uniref:C2H2-type domain-containing protein n=1 Tax=Steinernema carpocapsae TaxID=34508 RepID=A0A4U5P7R0_STECR|nr:hypothetical protein L596_006962 [Steinernema carpocapsae]